MAKILITGCNGQLGRCLLEAATHFPMHILYGFDVDQLDIREPQMLYKKATDIGATTIINWAAYTAVDQAQQEQAFARTVNTDAVMGMREVCERLGINLIHISTDYVFDGLASMPYKEDDQPNPLSVYGASKLAGEAVVLKYKRGVVVRTSWLYTVHGHNFISSILRLGMERDTIRVVNDQTSTPTYGPHLANALLQMVGQIETSEKPDSLMGLYHFADNGSCSRYEFALKIKEHAQFRAQIIPILSSEYPTPAKRPAFSVLNTQKITATFGIVPVPWEEGIKTYFYERV